MKCKVGNEFKHPIFCQLSNLNIVVKVRALVKQNEQIINNIIWPPCISAVMIESLIYTDFAKMLNIRGYG